MIAGNIVDYRNFLETTALAVAGVNKFIYGDAIKIVNYSRSNPKFGYPLVHVARPVVQDSDNGFGNITTVFHSEICAFAKVDKTGAAADADGKELDSEDLTLGILLELKRKLRIAHKNGQIEVNHMTDIEPVLEKWIDGNVGWKLSVIITLGPNSNLCR